MVVYLLLSDSEIANRAVNEAAPLTTYLIELAVHGIGMTGAMPTWVSVNGTVLVGVRRQERWSENRASFTKLLVRIDVSFTTLSCSRIIRERNPCRAGMCQDRSASHGRTAPETVGGRIGYRTTGPTMCSCC